MLVAGMQDTISDVERTLKGALTTLSHTEDKLDESQAALAKSESLNRELIGGQPNGRSLFELAAKPPKFGGDAKGGGAVHEFLHAMLTYLKMAQVHPMQYVSVASTFLEGPALTYYMSLASLYADSTVEWSDFEQGLKLTFGNVNQSVVARAELQNPRQIGSVKVYYKSFMRHCADITDMPVSENDRIMRFIQGLSPSVRNAVSYDPRTYEPYADITNLTKAALAVGSMQESTSGTADASPLVAGAFGRSMRTANLANQFRERTAERLAAGALASHKRPNEDAAGPSTSRGLAKRQRPSFEVLLADSEPFSSSLIAKGEKATGDCFFKNCSGKHSWQQCDLPGNQLVLARGRLRALEAGQA